MRFSRTFQLSLDGIRIARTSTVPFFVVTQLKSQVAELGMRGAEVSVVTSNGTELDSINGMTGVSSKVIDISRSISPLADVLSIIRLFILFKKQRTQIAHSTTPKAGLLTALAALMARVPVRLHTFTGQPWIDMRGPKRLLIMACDRLIGLLNTRCYADSASQRDFLIQQGIVDANRLFCIGAGSLAGVDLRRFDSTLFSQTQRELTRQILGIPNYSCILLFVGRITVDKGIRELLKAFQNLKNTGTDVHLVLVGPIDVESGVVGSISQLDIEDLLDVHVVGYSDNPETYLSIADILCLPSYREGFGTVVIEAAAMGVPTIGTNIYGLSDAVVNGETGLLVPPRNVGKLTTALMKLITDESLRLKMGNAAKQRATNLFDSRIINDQVVEEYHQLLKQKKLIK